MNAKISVLVTCVEVITYLLLYNLYDCTFKCSTNELPQCKEAADWSCKTVISEVCKKPSGVGVFGRPSYVHQTLRKN